MYTYGSGFSFFHKTQAGANQTVAVETDDETKPNIQPDRDDMGDDADPDTYDQYVGATVTLPMGDQNVAGKVHGRKREADGTAKGHAHPNPILDTRTYEVEFPDGQVTEYTANVIAESMYAQCDE